jgi:RNA polymerase sigma-70 factor (ECF subfamily)
MVRAARSVLGPSDLVWDVVQETMLRAWQRRVAGWPSTGELRWQAFRMAQHVLRGRRRRSYHEERASRSEASGSSDPLRETGAAEQRKRVERELGRLCEPYREALVLYLEHGSYRAVARALRLPVGTVRSRLARGRRALRARLPAGGEGSRRAGPARDLPDSGRNREPMAPGREGPPEDG